MASSSTEVRPAAAPSPAQPRAVRGPARRPSPQVVPGGPVGRRRIDRALSWLFRSSFGSAPLRFALADGTELWSPDATPVATVLMHDRVTALRLLFDPETHFGDAFVSGRVQVTGDLVVALESAYAALQRHGRARSWSWLSHGHSLRASRRNARRHYDLGNDFYRLWLDEQMLYTCAFFPRPDSSLEAAQVAKMERVCRKLRLRPGESVVEAGCGWGAMALHMARHYGVKVLAYNVSREQIRYARERAEREGLAERVEFVEDDYRRISGRFDAFVSVGMLEHVGLERYPDLGRVIRGCLHPEHGRGLLHFIGRDQPRPLNAWIRRHIFPGAYPPTLTEVFRWVMEPATLSVLDVENLRPHYARTLAHWRERFEAAQGDVAARYGADFSRAWHLYLAGSEAGFRVGSLQLFQVVFAPEETRDVAWSRGGDDGSP
jgi:cyclopropane-fatty-acyl-phospholipid synthase